MEYLALVKPARHSLPELDALRRDAETRPMLRSRHALPLVLPLVLLHARLEVGPPRQGPALRRGPGADLAAARTRGEIGVGLLVAHGRGRTFDADLDLERLPVKAERGPFRRQKLAPLSALVVGVEDEAALVHVL